MQIYKAVAGQSIYDVCLQTYGSLQYLYKLMQDNGIKGLNEPVASQQPFTWDDNLVVDQSVNLAFVATDKRYSTDVSALGSVYYVVNGGGGGIHDGGGGSGGGSGETRPKIQMVYNTTYTSTADGTTVITPLSINGESLAGFDIIQIELEIKPLIPEGQVGAEYVWNKPAGVLTLTNGVVADAGQRLSILYSKVITL